MPILSHCSHRYTLTTLGEIGIGAYALPGCHMPHHTGHRLVHRDSDRIEEERKNLSVCGSYPSQQGNQVSEFAAPIRSRSFQPYSLSLMPTAHTDRFLSRREKNNFSLRWSPHSKILLPTPSIWHQLCLRTLWEENAENHAGGSVYRLPRWWHPDQWSGQRPSSAWCQLSNGPSMAQWYWSHSEWQVWIQSSICCLLGQPDQHGWGKTTPRTYSAIMDMPKPQNVTEVRWFLGVANQLGKYAQSLAEESTLLRSLLVKNAA